MRSLTESIHDARSRAAGRPLDVSRLPSPFRALCTAMAASVGCAMETAVGCALVAACAAGGCGGGPFPFLRAGATTATASLHIAELEQGIGSADYQLSGWVGSLLQAAVPPNRAAGVRVHDFSWDALPAALQEAHGSLAIFHGGLVEACLGGGQDGVGACQRDLAQTALSGGPLHRFTPTGHLVSLPACNISSFTCHKALDPAMAASLQGILLRMLLSCACVAGPVQFCLDADAAARLASHLDSMRGAGMDPTAIQTHLFKLLSLTLALHLVCSSLDVVLSQQPQHHRTPHPPPPPSPFVYHLPFPADVSIPTMPQPSIAAAATITSPPSAGGSGPVSVSTAGQPPQQQYHRTFHSRGPPVPPIHTPTPHLHSYNQQQQPSPMTAFPPHTPFHQPGAVMPGVTPTFSPQPLLAHIPFFASPPGQSMTAVLACHLPTLIRPAILAAAIEVLDYCEHVQACIEAASRECFLVSAVNGQLSLSCSDPSLVLNASPVIAATSSSDNNDSASACATLEPPAASPHRTHGHSHHHHHHQRNEPFPGNFFWEQAAALQSSGSPLQQFASEDDINRMVRLVMLHSRSHTGYITLRDATQAKLGRGEDAAARQADVLGLMRLAVEHGFLFAFNESGRFGVKFLPEEFPYERVQGLIAHPLLRSKVTLEAYTTSYHAHDLKRAASSANMAAMVAYSSPSDDTATGSGSGSESDYKATVQPGHKKSRSNDNKATADV